MIHMSICMYVVITEGCVCVCVYVVVHVCACWVFMSQDRLMPRQMFGSQRTASGVEHYCPPILDRLSLNLQLGMPGQLTNDLWGFSCFCLLSCYIDHWNCRPCAIISIFLWIVWTQVLKFAQQMLSSSLFSWLLIKVFTQAFMQYLSTHILEIYFHILLMVPDCSPT